MTLHGVPSDEELSRLYFELAKLGAPSVGKKAPWRYRPNSPEELLALAGDMLRYDPRLLSILLELMLKAWDQFNPVLLRQHMRTMDWPQALLVLLEFASTASADPQLHYYRDYLSRGFPRVSPPERFFLEGPKPASRMDRRRGSLSLKEFSRWGFLGLERPTMSATQKGRVGSYDANTRSRLRLRLGQQKGAFTLNEYLSALDHGVSRQQAYNDLRRDPRFSSTGRGRGAKWRLDGAEAAPGQLAAEAPFSEGGSGKTRRLDSN